ncbi:hypothetical protein [Iodidimonas sp. SYSU 1G8]|uniref:hypothetical protein n=1 Tax=Iodidimonas sp. SYSU 1G8 TaxID=3133967 RepID=UPI0031FE4878
MVRIIYNDSTDPYLPGDVEVFRDIDEARREVESYDAEDPQVFICDEEGRRCRMWGVELRVVPEEVAEPFDIVRIDRMLAEHIRRYEMPGETLQEKLEQIIRRQGNGAAAG